MKTNSILLSFLFFTGMITGCADSIEKKANSIEGSWISTEETSWKFASGIQKIFLNIGKEKGEWSATGNFVWNDEFNSYLHFTNMEYDSMTHSVILNDTAGDSFQGHYDPVKNQIDGAFTSEGETDIMVFIPSGKDIETTMIYPRLPDSNGIIDRYYHRPEQLDDGLITVAAADAGFNPTAMDQLISDLIDQKFGRVASLLILKDNKLAVEEYFYGYDRTKKHHIYSDTKSITSLLLGIAMYQRPGLDLDQPVFDYFPQYDSLKTKEKEKITLKHFLTMSTGLEWNEYPREMYETPDRIAYVLGKPVEFQAGEKFCYNSGNTIVVGKIIRSLAGDDFITFADNKLFNPLGIEDYTWRKHSNWEAEYWNGLIMRPRDMAKIGLLVQNKGKWKDKQVVPEAWIQESTKAYIRESGFFDYGYHWWIRSKTCKRWWDNPVSDTLEETEMIVALAWGGQYIIIINEWNMVVVTTASNCSTGKDFDIFPMITERIIPALKANQIN